MPADRIEMVQMEHIYEVFYYISGVGYSCEKSDGHWT